MCSGEVALILSLTDDPEYNRASASDPEQWKRQHSDCCVLIYRRYIATGDLQQISLIKSCNFSASHLERATSGARSQVVEHRRAGAERKEENWRS